MKDLTNQTVYASLAQKSKTFNKRYRLYLISLTLSILVCFAIHLAVGASLVGKFIYKTENWVVVAQREKRQEALSVRERKILIVSGSNSLFGLSAEIISKEIGLPTVNFAVHAGLGIQYILDEPKNYLKPGDIVLLPLEYNLYISGNDIQDLYLRHVLSNDTVYFSNLNELEKINHIVKLPLTDIFMSIYTGSSKDEIVNSLKQKSYGKNCYTGFTLNEYGDETCNIGVKPSAKFFDQFAIPAHYEIDKGNAIESFINWCNVHNIQVIGLYPVMERREEFYSGKYRRFFDAVKEYYRNQKTAILGSPYEAMLPNRLMFNSNYHPSDEGRKYRTEQVISLIKPYT